MERKSSILEMARGSIMEQVDIEVEKIIANILDLNTDPKKKRTLKLTVDFVPSAERCQVVVTANAKSVVQPNNAIQTSLYVGIEPKTGEIHAAEMTPNIPGQAAFDDTEEEEPRTLKMVEGGRR